MRSNWLAGCLAMTLLTLVAGSPRQGTMAGAADTASAPSPAREATGESERQPTAIDLRPVFDRWGLETRRQGGRGTCSAFVVTAAIEYAVKSPVLDCFTIGAENLGELHDLVKRIPAASMRA